MSAIRTFLRLFTFQRVSVDDVPGEPLALAALWLGGTLLLAVVDALSPYPDFDMAAQFAGLGAMLLAALLAAWVLDKRPEAMRLGFAFMAIGLATFMLWAIVENLPYRFSWQVGWGRIVIIAWAVVAVVRLLVTFAGGSHPRKRVAAAYLATGLILWMTLYGCLIPYWLYQQFYSDDAAEDYYDIDQEALWTAQPQLVSKAVQELSGERTGGRREFVISVAAGGSQVLFAREAKAVRKLLAKRFAASGTGTVLSNAKQDLQHVPLANRTNLAALIDAIGHGFDRRQDVAVIYLTSHGSRQAELSTNLPSYDELQPISADFLAEKLEGAGITRRIVIVSACYSGTWIKPLASPDTIVVTAARADRTSFGCDDERLYSVFGSAFLASGLDRGKSLSAAFATLKATVSKEEAASGATPSLPQAFVGDHMQDFWNKP